MVSSLYEANILNQPAEWKRLLSIPLPRDLNTIRPKKIVFIGIGSSYWVARFAEFLWREHQTKDTIYIEPLSVQSFDFVKSKYVVSDNEIVVYSRIGELRHSVCRPYRLRRKIIMLQQFLLQELKVL